MPSPRSSSSYFLLAASITGAPFFLTAVEEPSETTIDPDGGLPIRSSREIAERFISLARATVGRLLCSYRRCRITP
jgi:hypothetical protein